MVTKVNEEKFCQPTVPNFFSSLWKQTNILCVPNRNVNINIVHEYS